MGGRGGRCREEGEREGRTHTHTHTHADLQRGWQEGEAGRRGVSDGCRRQIRLGRKTRSTDGSAGIRGSKGLSCAFEWKLGKKGSYPNEKGGEQRAIPFQGTPVPFGSDEKTPPPPFFCWLCGDPSIQGAQGSGLRRAAWKIP